MDYAVDELSVETVVEILARNPLQSFHEYDWEYFAGCDSNNPMIAYEENLAIILDGKSISVIDLNSDYADFVDFKAEEVAAMADAGTAEAIKGNLNENGCL